MIGPLAALTFAAASASDAEDSLVLTTFELLWQREWGDDGHIILSAYPKMSRHQGAVAQLAHEIDEWWIDNIAGYSGSRIHRQPLKMETEQDYYMLVRFDLLMPRNQPIVDRVLKFWEYLDSYFELDGAGAAYFFDISDADGISIHEVDHDLDFVHSEDIKGINADIVFLEMLDESTYQARRRLFNAHLVYQWRHYL